MASKWMEPRVDERDGTSQAGRSLRALSPSYVSVDERKAEDFLAFVREYGKTLRYYDENNNPAGYFSDLVGSLPLSQIAAFIREPEKADPLLLPELFRPHFVLLLAFLRLFLRAQAELNELTARHRDFYYRRFLRMDKRKALPDRLTLLLSLAESSPSVLVPAGTSVSAGPDSLGRDQSYRTERDIVVSHAEVASIRSLFLDRSRVSLRKCILDHRNDSLGGRHELLRIAYGSPAPGDAMPLYPGNVIVGDTKLEALLSLVKYSEPNLRLSLSDLRVMMERKEAVITAGTQEDKARWQKVTAILLGAARLKKANSTFSFSTSMTNATTFDAAASQAFGVLSVPSNPGITTVSQYWEALKAVETYFRIPVEAFAPLVDRLFGSAMWEAGNKDDVAIVVSTLEGAYRERIRSARRAALEDLHKTPSFTALGLAPLMQLALGDEPTLAKGSEDDLEDRLYAFLADADIDKMKKAAAAGRWSEACAILEVAMRNRAGEPLPEKEVWLNLYPCEDATSLVSPRVAPDSEGPKPWTTFGRRPAESEADRPAPVIGFAMSSPVLALSEGSREITLTLALSNTSAELTALKQLFTNTFLPPTVPPDQPKFPLVFEVSTAKGWVRCWPHVVPTVAIPTTGSYKTLLGAATSWGNASASGAIQFTIALPPGVDPVAPPPNALGGTDGRWPVLRVMLQPVWDTDRYKAYYRELEGLLIVAAHLKVRASGITSLALENEQSPLEPKKPFEPFGPMPSIGSRLLIGHPEVVTKKLDSIQFDFEWMNLPAVGLADHYKNYGGSFDFRVIVRSTDRSSESALPSAALFATGAATNSISGSLAPLVAADFAGVGAPLGERPSTWRRYLSWELAGADFRHRDYPAVAARKAMEFATDAEKSTSTTSDSTTTSATTTTSSFNKSAADYQVNPPYTPKLKSLSLTYTSSTEVILGQAVKGEVFDRLVHVHPFGCASVEAERTIVGVPLLPRYRTDSELYIGLKDAPPNERLALLFQFAEGTADRDLSTPKVVWSCLSGDRWQPFDHRVLSDTTRGLRTTGIVELGLERPSPSTRMPEGLTWIRAAVSRDGEAINDTIAIAAQAVAAVFDDQGNALDHYEKPIPGGTIEKLREPIAGIATVRQPYPSYGARPLEAEEAFATRVSERLRHKQRAISAWDYERLVLERFPEIYKAKCIPATGSAPGAVDVVVIPDVRFSPADRFEPKAPPELLASIQEYLAARSPASAVVRVKNPRYRAVLIRLGVRFSENGNESYFRAKLEEELCAFLSPWAAAGGVDITLGGKIHASSIIDFVDRRPYVSFVAGVHLFYSDDAAVWARATPPDKDGTYFVQAETPDTVLVSARQHRIEIIATENFDQKSVNGVGFWELELDFYVS